MVTNYMYPPKWVGPVGWIPRLATDPAGPQYFYLTALTANAEAIGNVSVAHSTFRGAEISEPLREGDAVELDGDVLHADKASGLWLQARRVKKQPIDRRELPPFQ